MFQMKQRWQNILSMNIFLSIYFSIHRYPSLAPGRQFFFFFQIKTSSRRVVSQVKQGQIGGGWLFCWCPRLFGRGSMVGSYRGRLLFLAILGRNLWIAGYVGRCGCFFQEWMILRDHGEELVLLHLEIPRLIYPFRFVWWVLVCTARAQFWTVQLMHRCQFASTCWALMFCLTMTLPVPLGFSIAQLQC